MQRINNGGEYRVTKRSQRAIPEGESRSILSCAYCSGKKEG